MGMTFTTIQIQNRNQLKPEQFIKGLSTYMKANNFVPATEEDAEASFELTFSKDRRWVSFCLPENEYCGKEAIETAQEIAKAIKSTCITADVIDSDFVEINLFNEIGQDKVYVGTPYGMEPETKQRNLDFWKPLLVENYTLEQLQEIWNGDYIFKEEALLKMAPLLGLDKELMAESPKIKPEDFDTLTLHLKKAGNKQKGKAPTTLNAAFKQVFGEALAPLGYMKIKGKQPYFVRVIDGEILHVITYKNEGSGGESTYKEFNILGGVATVYRQSIDLSISPRDNTSWLDRNFKFYSEVTTSGFDTIFRKSISTFSYTNGDSQSILGEVKRSLKVTKQIMLPLLNKMTNYESYLKYLRKYNLNRIVIYGDDEQFGNNSFGNSDNEGLLYVKANYRGDFMETIKSREEYAISCPYGFRGKSESYEEYYEVFCKRLNEIRVKLDEILDNPDKYANALAELERRKAANTEILRSYGLSI